MSITEQLDDIVVIQKVLAGDTALFEMLIRRYNSILYKTGRSYNFDHEDTQDLMQDTWVEIYLNLSKFENRSAFKTWMTRIMLNKCYKQKHKSGARHEITTDINDKAMPAFSSQQSSDANKIVLNRELNYVIEDALQQVPEAYRLVFSMRELNNLSVRETADILHLSETNVKARLSRAKAMLRNEIEKSYQPAEIFEFNLVYCDAIVNRVMDKIKCISNESCS